MRMRAKGLLDAIDAENVGPLDFWARVSAGVSTPKGWQGGPRYGLTNATIPCFTGFASCTTSVFADGEHPTTAAHLLIANAAYNRIVNGQDVAAVPEPATFVMVGSALVLLGLVRRRRARLANGASPIHDTRSMTG